MKLTVDGVYRFTLKEHIGCMFAGCMVCMVFGWLFYDAPVLGLIGVVAYGGIYRIGYTYKTNQYKKQLRFDFKDMMLSVYSSLSAGATLEESMRRAFADMERTLGKDARITNELKLVCQKMDRNLSVNQCLDEMAQRCDNEEIKSFSHVLSIGKRQGGNVVQLVRDSVGKIQRRIEISYEIEGIIGAKRSEFLFMSLIPAAIIAYMRMFSPEFMQVLYTGVIGRLCMTGCVVIYGAAVALGLHILKLD